MFPQFSATAETLSKASTMVFRIGTDAHLYDDPEDVKIAPLLDSKYDSEKCEALKRLLALIAQGFDVSNFFPQVVKNVASQSLEVKKLVYLYLLHYAEKRPSEALLSINYFQKDLGDSNPLVRAWALRAMAGIRLHVIAPIVLVAISKCARDPSVYVRKCAANALPKLYDLRLEEHTSALEEIVGILLNDNSPGVVGAAAAVFASICPNNLLLIGRNYRRLCESLPDVEEWGQIALIWILLRYVIARHGLVKQSIMFSLHNYEGYHHDKDGLDRNVKAGGTVDMASAIYESEIATMVSRSYIEGPDEFLSRSSFGNKVSPALDDECFTSGASNDDVRILLQCTLPLLWSQNSAVVLAAVSVHWIMSPMDHVERIVKPLLFLLRSSRTSKYVVLCNIQVFAKAIPSLFESHFEEFFVSSLDSYQIKTLKLEILSSIATDSSISLIFQEFEDYIRDPDRRFAADTVAAIGLCAQRLPKVANTCLEGLLALTRQETLISDSGSVDEEADVLIQAVMSIKAIINQDPSSHEKVIIQLIRGLDSIKISASRAMIVWMVGEYSSTGKIISKMLTTVLQYLAQCFTLEACETKLQILNTSAKVLNAQNGLSEKDLRTVKIIISYMLNLAECDLNYDMRDRAHFLKQLLSRYLGLEDMQQGINCLPGKLDLHLKLVECMFRGQKVLTSTEPINYRFYLPGTLSQIVSHAAPGYEPLPKPNCFSKHSLLRQGATESDSSGTDDQDTSSRSFNEEGTSSYNSQQSFSSSIDSEGMESAKESDNNVNAGSLINLSDVATRHEVSQLGSDSLENLMSKGALESWLDEKLDLSKSHASEEIHVRKSSATILIGDLSGRVKPKQNTLLDPANGNGLKVYYSFSSDNSSISSLLVCLEVFFENCTKEVITNVLLFDGESDKNLDIVDQSLVSTESSTSHNDVPTLVPIEEIVSLEPGKTTKRIIHVHFNHHLLPLKLVIHSNGKKHPVKLWPDIGYFVKPLPIDIQAFTNKEQQLPGMFEYSRRCIFTDHVGELNSDMSSPMKDKFLVICETIALKMLSNANIFLVSVDMPVASNLDDASGLCLRFSSEMLSNPVPCLVTIIVEGKCSEPLNISVKVNCEETVFGLNLLNRVINFLVEPSVAR